MNKYVIIVLFILLFNKFGYSQSDKMYTETLKEANEYLLEEDYTEPLGLLLDLEKKGYTFANIDFWIGYCYLHSTNKKDLAITRFESAIKQISEEYDYNNFAETKAPLEAYLFLGDAYLVNGQLAKAKAAYTKYQQLTNDPKNKAIAQLRIREQLVAKVLKKENNNCILTNAGFKINTGISNNNVCISGDGNSIVFIKKLKFYDALYYSVKSDSGWTEPKNITSEVGSDGYHIPTSLSTDGKKMLLHVFVTTKGFDIYESTFNGKRWSKAKKFPSPINTDFNEVDASYSSSGKLIIFSSNREGGFGGYDIYKTSYPPPQSNIDIYNIGKSINTPGNEKCPMLLDNDSVIVYNSDRLYGMGGFDYYHAKQQDDGSFSSPINLGLPFNTTYDDDQLKLSTQKKEGVISRTDPSGYTETDIQFFTYTNFGKFRFIPVNGKLQANDQNFDESKDVQVFLVDNDTKDTIDVTTPDSLGNYTTNIYPGDFNLIVKKGNDIEKIEEISMPDTLSKKEITLVTDIEPKITAENKPVTVIENNPEIIEEKTMVEPQKIMVLPDTISIPRILFDFNSSDITYSESDKIVHFTSNLVIQQIKNIKLKGYTDAIGSHNYNLNLSLKRASKVKTILVKFGIPESLISIDGLGATAFIAPNATPEGIDNPEGRALNRRVEIEIYVFDNKQFIIKNSK